MDGEQLSSGLADCFYDDEQFGSKATGAGNDGLSLGLDYDLLTAGGASDNLHSSFHFDATGRDENEDAFTGNVQSEDDVFGFGGFKEVFVTEEDLEKAKEKLHEDDVKSMEDILRDIKRDLLPAIVEEYEWNTLKELVNSGSVCNSVQFSVNGQPFALGRISHDEEELYFCGNSFSFNSNSEDESASQELIALKFSITQLTDIRLKDVLSTCVLNTTYRETLFLEFLVEDSHESEIMKGFVDSLNVLKSRKVTNIQEEIQPEKPLTLMNSPSDDINRLHLDYVEGVKILSDKCFDLCENIAQQQSEEAHKVDAFLTQIKEACENFLKEQHVSPLKSSIECELKQEPIAKESEECKLCYDNSAVITFLPCRHRVCSCCLQRLKEGLSSKSQLNCPWDRDPVIETVQ
eukprot:Nk52_evm77s62 gene=Nk52_evmTU77s62